jgi:hypothetical protein
MDERLIYLACPYSHPEAEVRLKRFNAVNRLAARLMRAGVLIFSPISHTHPIAEHGLPKGWDFWGRYDRRMLGICDELLVYCLDGWDTSVGVAAEVEAANAAGKRVRFHYPELEEIEQTLECKP